MTEYTLVFRRVGGRRPDFSRPYNGWMLARPELAGLISETSEHAEIVENVENVETPKTSERDTFNGLRSGEIAQVVVVPLCSTLALESVAYERFLLASEVLPHALRLLAHVRLTDARAIEVVRRRIQALVMAAEVQAIVENRSA